MPFLKKRKKKREYVARPGIEPRTPDLWVRCPTNCATRPGWIQGSKQEDSEGSEESKGGLDRCQCEEIETCQNKNNSKRAYQLVKDLTSEKQGTCRSSTIQDKSGKCLTEKRIFSADGQNIAQNCTTMSVVKTTQYWTAASPRKKICNQSSVRKLRLQ